MTPYEYHFDETWQRLSEAVSIAQHRAEMAEEAVRLYGYLEGRREALALAERECEEAEQERVDREEMISNTLWGMW
jgi:hypothetical protein